MRKRIFLGGWVLGAAMGFIAPAGAERGGPPMQALEARLAALEAWETRLAALEAREARIAALEAKVGADPRNARIELTAWRDMNARIDKKIWFEAGDEILLRTGSASLRMRKNGSIELHGKAVEIAGKPITVRDLSDTHLQGTKINQN